MALPTFYYIIPRTPVHLRTPIRDELWTLCKKALLLQTTSNWKAIIIGDTGEEKLDPDFFITLPFDHFHKTEKIRIAVEHIEQSGIKADYLIRLDEDDLISNRFLAEIQALPQFYECYYETTHTFIDLVYLKIGQSKNKWLPNTVIHKWEHAVTKCGDKDLPLILQDHSEYWHIYYSDKNVYKTGRDNPLYYRILTPFSVSSRNSSAAAKIKWEEHFVYLTGYGPWIRLSKKFFLFDDLLKLSEAYFMNKPKRSAFYWLYSTFKHYKNNLTNG